MDQEQFLTKVIQLYHQARKPLFPNNKIRRGRSRSIASAVEDLFALFLSERIICDLIYIDQPISIEGPKTQIYPDIVIIKNQKIVALCDIKMDLGWKRRELYNLCKHYASLLAKIKGKKCKIKDKITKKSILYHISRKVIFNIVIVSDQNNTQRTLQGQLVKIKPFNKTVPVSILTTSGHPNTYGISTSQLLKKIRIKKDFLALVKRLNNQI